MTLDPLRFVKFYATIKHGDQKYGELPYTHHLQAVESVLRRFGVVDEDMLTASWLHDTKEDCQVKIKELAEMFGDRVAELVDGVSNEPGENRKIRAALTYPKTRRIKGAIQLKLADRIANVENGGKLLDMYKKEYEDFRRALYTYGEYEDMWKHLDGLMVYKRTEEYAKDARVSVLQMLDGVLCDGSGNPIEKKE
jgi:guanosine-3',5'-bis(diphosphate) 3'-pyrophosphohydrolase